MTMNKRLILSLSLYLISVAAVASSSVTVVNAAGGRSNEHLSADKGRTAAGVEDILLSNNKTRTGRIIRDGLDKSEKYDVTLTFLENKVWDVIVVTDNYGLTDPMANEEDDIFMKAVSKTGRTVHRASIEDEDFDWRAGKSIVIRTAWTKFYYLTRYKAFLDSVNTHAFLFNPPALIHWQSNKIQYMRQLAQYVKVPHTLVVPSDSDSLPGLEKMTQELGCDTIVIKPTSGNSGHGVTRGSRENSVYLEERMYELMILEDEDLLVQCFMHSIAHDGIGEIEVFIVDGQVTHGGWAVPPKEGYLIHEEFGGYGDQHWPSEQEISFALDVYNAATTITGVKPLYFRVDMMYDNDGDLTLMEIACGTTDMDFRVNAAAADVMAVALDNFLKAKEAKYEMIYGPLPPLIEMTAFEDLMDVEFDSFGTPMRDGKWGQEKPWLKMDLNRTFPTEEEMIEESPYRVDAIERLKQQKAYEEARQKEQEASDETSVEVEDDDESDESPNDEL